MQQQDLLAAQDTFSQDAQFLADQLPEQRAGDVPTLAEALREASSRRPEIEQVELNLRNQEVEIQAVRNSLLPSLDVYASYYVAG